MVIFAPLKMGKRMQHFDFKWNIKKSIFLVAFSFLLFSTQAQHEIGGHTLALPSDTLQQQNVIANEATAHGDDHDEKFNPG